MAEGFVKNSENEIEIGPFSFEYDPRRREMFIARGEENDTYVEFVSPKQWEEFVNSATCGEL